MLLSRVVKAAIVLDCTRFPAVSKHSPRDAALPAVAACLLLAVAMYGLAGYALRVRTRRK
jgi:hypothetical protein